MKKIMLITAFLAALLLFGVWIHAATIRQKRFTIEPKDAVTVVEEQRIWNWFLLQRFYNEASFSLYLSTLIQ